MSQVTVVIENEMAIIRLNNPPVNAISHAVRSGLIESLEQAEQKKVKGAIIIGSGNNFIAGSDLKEFGQPIQAPELPDVIHAIEMCSFPVVVAIHGVALGGGLELALGCDYRIVAEKTKLGLPEVSLGMIPGAGGTQRLPRLVGQLRSIEMICGSKRIDEKVALEAGLVDAIAIGDLLEFSKAYLLESIKFKRIVKQLTVPKEDQSHIDDAVKHALKKGRGRPNVEQAIAMIQAAATDGNVDTVLSKEREIFQALRIADDAFALRYQFFSERKATETNLVDQSESKTMQRVAVIGGGTMGQGIVRALLSHQIQVTLVERDDNALNQAISSIQAYTLKPSTKNAETYLTHLKGVSDLNLLQDCDLVIEAVFEDMAVKKALLQQLESIVPIGTILATNTSYLDINDMISGLKHPDRVVGLHFFSPADVMKLLEIVSTDRTSSATLKNALKFAKKIGKQAVMSKVGEGFIGNRIYAAYRKRAELLVLDGADPTQIDRAMRNFGMAMGPFEVSDLSGLDIAWAMRKRLANTRDPQARYVDIADQLCERNRLGRKTSKGWYNYTSDKAFIDEDVQNLIHASRIRAQIQVKTFDEQTIQHQLLAAMINEAACVLQDGIAQHVSDIDVVLVNGYGFPRWKGGPLYWAAHQERRILNDDLQQLAHAIGHGHRQGHVDDFLHQIPVKQ